MSEFSNNAENNSEILKIFCEKIWELKRAEEEAFLRDGRGSVHFQSVNPDELTNEDMGIYEKYLANALTKEEFEKYRKQFNFVSIEDSRHSFSAFIGNKLAVRLLQAEINQERSQQK